MTSPPTSTAELEADALLLEHGDAAVDVPLLELEVGDAEAQEAAGALVALEHDDVVAGAVELLGGGEARRARADDRDAAPRAVLGRRGTIQPSSHARSTMASSIFLIETGSSLMASTQAGSHGAGQIRPVNSGKSLVACSWSIASRQRCW